jgi:(4-(4-[2-(gamma-L-glutamylamino)ethyl]phenoxymethyl)furan-2-yl)methanamine synthase
MILTPARYRYRRRTPVPHQSDQLYTTDSKQPISEANCPNIFGIDIGGANIKLSHCQGGSRSLAFPMWTEYRRLGAAIAQLLAEFEPHWDQQSCLAITMTGELADCFESRRAGVAAILDEVARALPPSHCHVYSVDGNFVSMDRAKQAAWRVAASNWHALANWLLLEHPQLVQQCQLIMDIGSTTVDIIPISQGCISTAAKTDRERLQLGQLVYTGMERTPIHAIVREVVIEGQVCPLMAERFATIMDVHLILGTLAAEPDNCDTADGRPRTRQWALSRLARMIGEDAETLAEQTIIDIASQVLQAQAVQVCVALAKNISQNAANGKVLVTGHGWPLVQHLQTFSELQTLQFVQPFLGETSRCAPALAVARLWMHQRQFRSYPPPIGLAASTRQTGRQHG